MINVENLDNLAFEHVMKALGLQTKNDCDDSEFVCFHFQVGSPIKIWLNVKWYTYMSHILVILFMVNQVDIVSTRSIR